MSDKSTMAHLNCKDGSITKTHHDSMQDVFGSPGAMASALRSVGPWALLHSVPGLDERETEISSSTFNGEGTEEGAGDPPDEEDQSEEDVPPVLFQSKYIDMFPLYQDYLPSLNAALQRARKGSLNELVTCQLLPGLQSPLSSHSPTTEFSSPTTSCSSMVTQHTPSPQPVRVNPSCTLWQDLPEVKESGLLNMLTTRELRLQEARFELIGSEASYLRSLGIAVNHFFASKKLRKSLSRREQHILFSNLRNVMEASESFLMELETLLGANVTISHVEDIVLNHCSTFQAHYVPYVTNMQYQEALVCRLLEENRHFLHAMKKLEDDPVCQRRGLKSFLILPFQRITRLKLIMQNILKLTKPDCGAVSSLKQSIEAIHQIVDKCNKGVQKMQEIEQLVQLELRLDFGTVKKVPLIVSGRFLVHEGALRQLTLDERPSSQMTFTDVYLHLFNDLLVISLKKDQRFAVEDHAVFPTHVHVKLLKPNALGLPSDSFLLHLSQNCTGQPTVLILATHTRSDKEVWMKVLM